MVFVPVVAIQDVKVELPSFLSSKRIGSRNTKISPTGTPSPKLDGSDALEALNGKVVDAPTLETPDDSPANDEREDSPGCACAVSVQPSCEEDGVNEETSEAGEREDVEDVQQEFAAASPTTTIIEKFAEKNGVPPLIVWNAFKEEITKAADKIEKSTGIFSSIEEAMDTVFDKIGDETEDAIYTQVNKFNGSAFQVVNQTADEVIDAGEDPNLISTTLSRTKTANKLLKSVDQISKNGGLSLTGPIPGVTENALFFKETADSSRLHAELLSNLEKAATLMRHGKATRFRSLAEDGKPTDTSLDMDDANDMAASHAAHIIASPESLNPTINGDVEYDQESEGEGMEISLAYNIGDTRTLAEI